jgi:hypothetical protein
MFEQLRIWLQLNASLFKTYQTVCWIFLTAENLQLSLSSAKDLNSNASPSVASIVGIIGLGESLSSSEFDYNWMRHCLEQIRLFAEYSS